ncbi:MAG: hypothetical protein AAGK78_01520 [Planctomycetota bacterium]
MLTHRTSLEFWRHFDHLPREIQRLAVKQYALLQEDPLHPSVQFKNVDRYWSARVSRSYRALAERKSDGTYLWFWIGPHDGYDLRLKN